MTKRFMIIMVLMLMPVASWAEDVSFRVYAAAKVITAPRMDGILDEACWQKVELGGGFEAVIYSSGVPTGKTNFNILYDDKNIYLGFNCLAPDTEKLKTTYAGLRGKDCFEDSVEIFLDPQHDHSNYYHFMVSITGYKYEGKETDASWNAPWDTAADFTDTGYSIEVRIPFASLSGEPSATRMWGINLNRNRMVGNDKPELSSWSDIGNRGFHAPDRFGHLVFGIYSEWLNNYFSKEIKETKDTIAEYFKRYPNSTKRINKEDGVNNNTYKEFWDALKKETISEKEAVLLYRKGEELRKNYTVLLQNIRFAVITNEFE